MVRAFKGTEKSQTGNNQDAAMLGATRLPNMIFSTPENTPLGANKSARLVTRSTNSSSASRGPSLPSAKKTRPDAPADLVPDEPTFVFSFKVPRSCNRALEESQLMWSE